MFPVQLLSLYIYKLKTSRVSEFASSYDNLFCILVVKAIYSHSTTLLCKFKGRSCEHFLVDICARYAKKVWVTDFFSEIMCVEYHLILEKKKTGTRNSA